jgi:preprotein translocase subunit SecE
LPEENVENPSPIPAKKEVGIIQSIKQAPELVASVRQEMKLFHRPTWYEVQSTTVLVVVFFCLFVLYFNLLGRILTFLGRWLPLR